MTDCFVQLGILRDLQTTADMRHNTTSADVVDITFKPAQLWHILDYSVAKLSSLPGEDRAARREPNGQPSATLHVATTFVHPLEEEPGSNVITSGPPNGLGGATNDGFGDLTLDNFFFDYFLTDYTQNVGVEDIGQQG